MALTKNCTWLHISDIHFKAKDNWRHSKPREALLQCLVAHFSTPDVAKPDFIFCTGDIGFGDTTAQTLSNQYVDARRFFDELLKVCQVERGRLFLVPGNHDVIRSEVDRYSEKSYRQMAKEHKLHEGEINQGIATQSKEYKTAVRRLDVYRAFFRSICPHVELKDDYVHYAHKTSVGSLKVQIIGLNSAWCCSGTESDRDVWVGARSQLALVDRDNTLRIGLIHHPLEWITKADSGILEGRMGNDLHVLLHGHEHEFREHQFRHFPVIGAGAVSAYEDGEHNVVIATLNLNTGTLGRAVYAYKEQDGLWYRSPMPSKDLMFPVKDTGIDFETSGPASTAAGHPQWRYEDYFVRPGRLAGAGEFDYEYEEAVEPGAHSHIRDSEYFQHLWSDAMGPHTVEVLAGDAENLHYDSSWGSTRMVQKDNLDAYFLRKVVILPEMTETANDDENDRADARLSFESFRKEVSESPRGGSAEFTSSTKSENRVRYLVGDAGVGKTLAVLKLIDMIRQDPTDAHGYHTVTVYIDLHQDKAWTEKEPSRVVHLTVDRIGRKLHAELPADLQSQSPFHQGEFKTAHDLDEAVRILSALYAKSKLMPLIIVDNGDRFFFENARYRFFPDFARRRDWHLDDTFVALVDRFVLESSLGKIGASVLFVCRKYVYQHCLRISDAADPTGPVRQDHKVYQIFANSPEYVLAARIKLISNAIDAVAGKYRNAEMFRERLKFLKGRLDWLLNENTSGREPALRTLWRLAPQGHRSWLHFLSALPVDVGPGAEVADRIFTSPRILLRLYITNMRKRYTQKHGHFPNIFLNDALVLASETFGDAHQPHLHSYWLKYLILKYVSVPRRERTRKVFNSENVIRFFVDDLKYEDHLVRLAVGSLSDPATSMCLRIVRPDRIVRHIEQLQLSDRGEVLIAERGGDGPLCFSFDYLQLITDDYLLALPTSVAEKIFVDANLAHTLKAGGVYGRGARETLTRKIPAVLWFFRVLQLSFFAEAKARGTLRVLNARGLTPNFQSIGESLLSSIGRVDSHFDIAPELLPNPRQVWTEALSEHSIESLISRYYDDKVSIAL